MTGRETLVRLLRAEAPETDFTDDEAIYAQVISDYEDYARLLTMEQEMEDTKKRQAEEIAAAELRGRNAAIEAAMAPIATDGTPHLGGASAPAASRRSYFDLARI